MLHHVLVLSVASCTSDDSWKLGRQGEGEHGMLSLFDILHVIMNLSFLHHFIPVRNRMKGMDKEKGWQTIKYVILKA